MQISLKNISKIKEADIKINGITIKIKNGRSYLCPKAEIKY